MTELANARLAEWASFYVIVGSSGAALIGMQFVVMTLIANMRVRPPLESLHAFGTPTVVQLTGALLVSAIMSAPWPSLVLVALTVGMCGLGGMGSPIEARPAAADAEVRVRLTRPPYDLDVSDQDLNIHTIVGSTRPQRFCEKPARWICDELKGRSGVHAELVDLRDYPLPFFDAPVSPARLQGKYPNPVAAAWARKVDEADGYVIVTPEYNHGYTGVLKNAFDWTFPEWNNKPVAFVSYGGVGGARVVEQLRLVAIELEMAPIRWAVHLPVEVYRAVMNQDVPVDPKLFQPAQPAADRMINQLLWWAHALKTARLAVSQAKQP